MEFERSLQPLRDQITKLQLEEQAASLGGAQYMEQLQAAAVDLAALAEGIEQGGVKLWGLQGEIDRINREIAGLGAVNAFAERPGRSTPLHLHEVRDARPDLIVCSWCGAKKLRPEVIEAAFTVLREIACSDDFEVLEIVAPADFKTRIVEAPAARAAE